MTYTDSYICMAVAVPCLEAKHISMCSVRKGKFLSEVEYYVLCNSSVFCERRCKAEPKQSKGPYQRNITVNVLIHSRISEVKLHYSNCNIRINPISTCYRPRLVVSSPTRKQLKSAFISFSQSSFITAEAL